MTDARLRGAWLTAPNMIGLSDRAWRVFTGALMWCAEQGTDGAVGDGHLRFFSEVTATATYDEIESAGLWRRVDGGYQFMGWDSTLGQSTAATVETYRSRARDRARRYRETQRARELAESGRDLDEEEVRMVVEVAERIGDRIEWARKVLEVLRAKQPESVQGSGGH